MQLDRDAALRAQEKIARSLGLDTIEAVWGIHQVVNENMANAARVHAVERGKDPRVYPLFAFDGAGPMHGYSVARALGVRRFIAPLGAGATSAFGLLCASLSFDFVRSLYGRLHDLDWSEVNGALGEM
jgi:N-methylhydantoinase A